MVHALQHAPEDRARRLREVLDQERETTTAEEVAEVTQLLVETGSLAFALDEISQRRERARQVMQLLGHDQLTRVVTAMCDLFLEPIQPVIERYGQGSR